MKQRNKEELIVEAIAIPMVVEDYERLINLIGKNLFHSIKAIQLAVEVAQLTSNDDGFKNVLELFLKRAKEIERDMHKSSLENGI